MPSSTRNRNNNSNNSRPDLLKIPVIQRIAYFSCKNPEDTIKLAHVSSIFDETMTDEMYGSTSTTIFERLFTKTKTLSWKDPFVSAIFNHNLLRIASLFFPAAERWLQSVDARDFVNLELQKAVLSREYLFLERAMAGLPQCLDDHDSDDEWIVHSGLGRVVKKSSRERGIEEEEVNDDDDDDDDSEEEGLGGLDALFFCIINHRFELLQYVADMLDKSGRLKTFLEKIGHLEWVCRTIHEKLPPFVVSKEMMVEVLKIYSRVSTEFLDFLLFRDEDRHGCSLFWRAHENPDPNILKGIMKFFTDTGRQQTLEQYTASLPCYPLCMATDSQSKDRDLDIQEFQHNANTLTFLCMTLHEKGVLQDHLFKSTPDQFYGGIPFLEAVLSCFVKNCMVLLAFCDSKETAAKMLEYDRSSYLTNDEHFAGEHGFFANKTPAKLWTDSRKWWYKRYGKHNPGYRLPGDEDGKEAPRRRSRGE